MSHSQPTDDGHGLAERGLDDSIAHADDEQQEERKRVSERVEHSNDDHEHLGPNVVAVTVLVIVEAPSHEHFHYQKDEDGCDVILNRKNVVPVLIVEEAPEKEDDKINDCYAPVEGQFCNLRCWKLAVRIAERDDCFVFYILGVGGGSDAVVPGLDCQLPLSAGDRVVDRFGVVEMNSFGTDVHLGNVVGIVGEDPFAFVGAVAELRINGVVVADVGTLQRVRMDGNVSLGVYSRRQQAFRSAFPAAASPSTPKRPRRLLGLQSPCSGRPSSRT